MARILYPLAIVIPLVWLAPPEPALAGAWTRPAGSGQLITKLGRKDRPIRTVEGQQDTGAASIAQVYGEYGLTDDWTVGADLLLDVVPEDPTQGSAAAGVFARRRLWQRDDGWVASAEAGVSAPAERIVSEAFAASKPYSAVDLGLTALFGKSFWGDWGSAYVSTGAGYHHRFEDQPAEFRYEASAGFTPGRLPCCVAMLSLYGLEPLEPGLTEPSLVLAPSLGWHVRRPPGDEPWGPRTTLQLGAALDLLDGDDGPGLFLGVWQAF